MTSVSIIGIGSPHGVDQVGWLAIESLKKDHALQTLIGNSVKYITLDRPGMALLDQLNESDYTILIDAIQGGIVGKVVEVQMENLANSQIEFSTHSAGVAEALAMGTVLNKLPVKLEIFGIEVGDLTSNDMPELVSYKHLNQLVFDHIQSYLK